ncbi:MAG: hypothetical protein A3G21_16860 [Acidobacteria bacterium RIFCSPLOWO2_12_FULL_66_21]|nr:MAG: hypothetical protein A3G21_16860 [Acidobacteria bacterium RIFCSPLOWO2_12_FULL_66_21]
MSRIAPVALAVAFVASPAPAQTVQRPAVRDLARELACGPAVSLTSALPTLRIVGGKDLRRTLFAPGDPVVINGGSAQGVKAGQDYFVRRLVADRFVTPMTDGTKPKSIHTAGWIHILEVGNDSAIATVTQACDGVIEGDYIEPFALPALPSSPSAGEPDYANPGHVMLADDRRQIGGAGSLMVLDRGSDHGLRSGQALTIFRPTAENGGPVFRIARATAVVIGAETSLIRIDDSSDAINVGDLVAIHR